MTKELTKYKNIITVIAIAVLLLAIPSGIWPYGYFVLLRWVITGAALYNIWVAYNLQKMGWVWIMGGIALLFNPIVPLHLDKSIWQVLDLVAASIFLVSIFKIRIKA